MGEPGEAPEGYPLQGYTNIQLKLKACKVLPLSTNALLEMTDLEVENALDTLDHTESIQYDQWLKKKIIYKGKEFTKTKLVEVTEPIKKFVDGFFEGLPDFRDHVRRIYEQYAQV